MSPIDTYRDAFLKFLAQGMTHAEALEQFDEKEFEAAWLAELEIGDRHYNVERHRWETSDGRIPLVELVVAARIEQGQQPDEQCLALWSAGWTSEVPNPQYGPCQTMSLYWRRPSKRADRPGRLYRSTQQAFNALRKE